MTYIVVSENEIVKAEMERPVFKGDYFLRYGPQREWEEYIKSLPRIPIQGEHKWEVWQEVKEGKDFYLMDTDKWYWCKCEKCGWEGSSQLCKGGGPIADTGDYDDALCPECMSNDLDGETDNGPEDYTSIVAIPIEQTKSEQGETVFGEWQLCPKCNGQGMIEKPPYLAAEETEWISTGVAFTCDVCNGAKVLARPLLNINHQTR